MSDGHGFEWALARMKERPKACVGREGWDKRAQYIAIQEVDAANRGGMRWPYIYMQMPGGGLVPWVPSQVDLLANDWAETKYYPGSLDAVESWRIP